MPTVRYSIDSRGAEQGAERFSAAIRRVVADAQRAAQAIGVLDRAMGNLRGSATASREIQTFLNHTQRIPRAVAPAAQQVGGFSVAMRNLGSASVLAFGPLSGVGARITAVGAAAARSTLPLGAAVAGLTGLGVAVTASVRAAAEFEAGMLRVAKVTDATNVELARMSADVIRLSSTLGIPAGELAKIEQGAAQLGIRGSQNLAAFAEQVAMLTRTSDLGAEQATQALARLLNITGESTSNVAGMAAALTDLGNKSAASESQILSMTLELGRGTAAFDVSSQQLLSLGAALAEVGEKSERSATAVSQVFIAITDAASGGDNLEKFADVLGVTAEEFQRLAQRDIGDVFVRIMQVLARQGPEAVATLRELEIGSARNTKVLLSLAEVLDRYQRNLSLVANEYRNPLAATQEFARMNDSAAFQLAKVGVQLQNMATIFGSAFLPAINETLQTVNAFLLLLQDIEPPAGQANTTIRLLADGVQLLGDAIGFVAAGLPNFLASFAGPQVGGVLNLYSAVKQLYELFNAAPDASGFPSAAFVETASDAEVLSAAVRTLTGDLENASHAPRTVAEALDALAASADGAAGSVARTSKAVAAVLADLDKQVELRRIELEHGKAAAETQKIINDLAKDGKKVSETERAEIEKRVRAMGDLDDRLRDVSRTNKDVAKSADEATKAYESLQESLADVIRDLENQLELQGLDEGQRQVVELTQKIDELRERAVRAGADEAQAREAANAALAEAIPLQQRLNAAKAEEYRQGVLDDLREQVELRRIETTEGKAAAETQRIINEAKRAGVDITDDFVAGVRESTQALEEFESQSTVVADAFEDFISGIARGTQELNLDGIADAFKAAFAASVKEKLKFDEIFKGNLFDLVGFAAKLFSGGVIDIGGLFSFGGGATGGSGSGLLGLFGGGGGSLLGLGGGALAALALGGGGGLAGFAGNNALSLGINGLSLLNSGYGLLTAGVGQGGGLLGTLFGGSATIGSILGPELGGAGAGLIDTFFGAGSGASFMTGTTVGSLLGSVGGVAGGVGGALGAWQLGQGGDATAIVTSLVSIVAGFAAVLNAFGPIGSIIYGIVVALTAIASAFTDITPTAGTLRRRMGESAIDALPTFTDLQEQLGDVTRKNYNIHANPDLPAQREQLGSDALRDIAGFSTIFAQAVFGDSYKSGKDHVASIALEWTNILTEFFSRMEGESDEVSLAIRQNLLAAFKDLGVDDAAEAFDALNAAAENFKLDRDFNYFQEPIDKAKQLGTAVRGIASIFESELPAGVHIAALALETMSKDGVTFFGDLDKEGRETLLNLSKDAENFDKVVAHLFEQGFEIDTEEFRRRLEAITASAEQVGESIGGIFDAGSAEAAIQQMLQSLKGTIKEQLGGGFLEQLFDKTQIAGVFEPVFDVLNRLDEFDLTTAGGMQQFRAEIIPAILEGKANLQEYLPALREMLKNWREIEKAIDEALEPTAAEQMALSVTQAFEGIGEVFSTGIQAGLAVLADGGSYQQALDAFNSVVGQGIESTLKQAIFNALVNSVVIRPLIEKYAPAFSLVAAAGLEHGFGDPRVRAAWQQLMDQLGADVEAYGPLIFDAQLELVGQENAAKQFFVKLEVIAENANQRIAQGFGSLLRESIDIAMEDGVAAGQKHFSENIGDVVYNALLDAIVQAFVDAAIVQGILGDSIAEGAALYAAAYSPDGPGGSLVTDEERRAIDIWRAEFRDLYRIATDAAEDLANGIIDDIVNNDPRESTDPNIRKRRETDADPIEFEGGRNGRRFPGAGSDFPESNYDIPGRRRVIEETEDLADRTMAATNALGDFSTAVREAIRALGDLGGAADDGGSSSGPGSGRKLPGAARGGAFGPGASFIVGEVGPELVVNGPGGVASVIPLDYATANALLEGGMPGYARGFPWERGGGAGGGGRTGTGRGPGAGWGPGGPHVGPDDARHPDNRERPGDGASADEVLVKLQIEAALDEYFRSGDFMSFAEQFERQVNEAVAQGVMSALLESGPIAAAIERFNEGLTKEIEKAWADGSLSDEEIERIKARMAELGGPIKDLIEKLGPEIADLFADLGIGDSVASDLRGGFESAVRGFLTTGSVEELEVAVREAFFQATIDGIVAGLLLEGPIADAIENASTEFRDAVRDAMEDGVITDEEATRLRALGEQLGADVQTAIAGIGPGIAGIFDGARDRAAEAAATAGQLLGGALRGALNDPRNFTYDTFSQALRQQIFQSVAGGLIDAFIEAAVIQGALAPMLGAIQLIFEQIGKRQIDIAEANGLIAEQIGLMLGVLEDPAFQEAIKTLIDGVRDLGDQLRAFPDAANDVARAAGDVSEAVNQAEKDVCDGKCGLTQETLELGDTILDAAGRAGYAQDLVWRELDRHGGGGGTAPWTIPDTYGGPNGRYGDWEWSPREGWLRRQERRARRQARSGRDESWQPGDPLPDTYGGPTDTIYDPRIPRFADGGIVTEPTLGWIAEAGKSEAVIPLDRLGDGYAAASSSDIADLIDELREELREQREDNRELRSALREFIHEIQSRPIHVEAKVGEEKAIDILVKLMRLARDSGVDLQAAMEG